MKIRNKKLSEAFNLISEINQKAYEDVYLISNPVFSKNPFSSKFIRNYINGQNNRHPSTAIIFFKLCKYYFKSFVLYFLYIFQFPFFRFVQKKFEVHTNNEELILIDTFFLANKIEQAGHYSDPYFPSLEKILKEKSKRYAYLPVFYGRDPLKTYRVLQILKKESVPIFSEFQLLSVADLIELLVFIVTYPLHVISFVSKIKRKPSHHTGILLHSILESLDQVVFSGYSRYLQGKKIAALPYSKIKCISWYENQIIHKNLYKGLREKEPKVIILGAQLFIWPELLLNIHPDERENALGVVPDRILVNGKYYMPRDTQLNYSVGPSLRYKKLFSFHKNDSHKKSILVLLPYFHDSIENLFRMLREINISTKENVLIKFHPTTNKKRYLKLLPSSAQVTEKDIYSLFESAKIVISTESGAMVEALSVGIPVIVIDNNGRYMLNYLPSYGKGILWDVAKSREELIKLIYTLNQVNEHKKEESGKIAQWYREMFFCEPTEDKIIEAFDL